MALPKPEPDQIFSFLLSRRALVVVTFCCVNAVGHPRLVSTPSSGQFTEGVFSSPFISKNSRF